MASKLLGFQKVVFLTIFDKIISIRKSESITSDFIQLINREEKLIVFFVFFIVLLFANAENKRR